MKTPYQLRLPAGVDPYLRRVLEVAAGECGVAEYPSVGQNRGPEVDAYLRAVRLRPEDGPVTGYPWCQAFVYWCFRQASLFLNQTNPCARTAGVKRHWELSRARRVAAVDVARDHSLVRPGMVFCKSADSHSHAGFVVATTLSGIVTVEGNTNLAGSREGNAVVGGKARSWEYVQLGYLDYAGMSSPLTSTPATKMVT